jgi:hypothetical protein
MIRAGIFWTSPMRRGESGVNIDVLIRRHARLTAATPPVVFR